MCKHPLTTVLIAVTLLWIGKPFAQEVTYADLIRISALGEKFEKTTDPSYLYTATVRCASVYAVNGFISEQMGNAELAANLYQVASELQTRSVEFKTIKWDHEPTEQELQEQQKLVLASMEEYHVLLATHISRNYKTTGEHFGNDPIVLADMEYCKKVYNLEFAALEGLPE